MQEFKYFANVVWSEIHPLLFVLWDINAGTKSCSMDLHAPWTAHRVKHWQQVFLTLNLLCCLF